MVFESDDWGSIRMSSRSSRDRLKSLGHDFADNSYHYLDGLESNGDMESLLNVLNSVKDRKGNGAIFTLNYCSANPDFQKIEANDYSQYFREPFDFTYKEYVNSNEVIKIVKQGENQDLFDVQFHGTEHLNIPRWIRALRNNDALVHQAFKERVFSPSVGNSMLYPMEFMDALDYDSNTEVNEQVQALKEGLSIFKRIWNKSPRSFIAPCYRWSEEIERFLFENQIPFIQGQRAQLHPKNEFGYRQKKIYHYTGEKNKYGQIYGVRNVIFEPSIYGVKKALNLAKRQIAIAFYLKVPAIISSHRINYTSRLDNKNAKEGLEALRELLDWTVSSFPSVEFMGSSKLSEEIQNSKE